jgi:hypothetical protein
MNAFAFASPIPKSLEISAVDLAGLNVQHQKLVFGISGISRSFLR